MGGIADGNCIEDNACWIIAGCMKPAGNCIFGGCCAAVGADGSAGVARVAGWVSGRPTSDSDGLNAGAGDFGILSITALAE